MAKFSNWTPKGVIPAALLPFRGDFSIDEESYPLAQAFYAPPFLDMHNRMKEVLALIGRLPPAVVRPPLVKLPAAEIERLRQAAIAAGLGAEPLRALAAE